MKKAILILQIVFSAINPILAQQYSFNSYGVKDGLESPELNNVFADSRGFIWIGSPEGLIRFDGVNFKYFDAEYGLTQSEVIGITEDSTHNIIISTNNKIFQFNGSKFSEIKIKGQDTAAKFLLLRKFYQTPDNKLFAMGKAGAFLYNQPTNQFQKFKPLAQTNLFVSQAIQDQKGKLYFGTSQGLFVYFQNKMQQIIIDTAKATNSITCITFDKDQNLWMGTTKGIVKYDGKTFSKYFSDGNNSNRIRDVKMSVDGTLVFTSDENVIRVFKNNEFFSIDMKEYISHCDYQDITRDKDGNFWITGTCGLIKMLKKPFSKYPYSDSIKAATLAFEQNKNNELFFATTDGLYKSSNNKFKKYYPSSNTDDHFITSLFSTDSCLYLGTYSGQVFKFKNEKFTPIGNNDVGGSNAIYKIITTGPNEMWFTKLFTVNHYINGNITKHEIAPMYTQSALLDSKGAIWFANMHKLTTFKNNHWQEFSEKQGFKYQYAVTLSEDNNHNIWIGTYGNGLFKYNGNSFQRISKDDGLVSNFICASYFDKQSNQLWITTINGISKIVLNAKAEINAIHNYRQEQGLDNVECSQNAIVQLPNSSILVGTGIGVYQYNPQLESNDTSSPKLYFQGIQLFNQNTDWTKLNFSTDTWSNMPNNLTLPYNKNYLTFNFTGINLLAPQNLNFQWMLKGFDQQWLLPSKNKSTTYSNIPPGNYTFLLRACNTNGYWSAPISYSFTINPPFYKTAWFISLTSILLIVSTYIIFKTRIKTIRKQATLQAQAELKAIRAQLNPHFMFNTLNAIQDMVINKDETEARLLLADFATLMRTILENSSQTKITLNNELAFLKLYTKLESTRFNNRIKINYQIQNSIAPNHILIPPMLIQPFIENAFNHAFPPTITKPTININFKTNDTLTELICTIEDNGIGIQANDHKSQNHKSLATKITNERIVMLNTIEPNNLYSINIQDLANNSNNSSGTKITIIIPLNQ